MPLLDDPFEPQDTVPGSQPRAPGTLDAPLPQVAAVPPDHLPPPEDAAQATAAALPQPQVAQAPQVPTRPDGTPLTPGTAWARNPGAPPGGPYTQPVTEGEVPSWIPERARWQALAFRRERVPGRGPGGYAVPG